LPANIKVCLLKLLSKITTLLLLLCVINSNILSQDTLTVRHDTIPVKKEKVKRYTIDPIRSTLYAAALPGLGQIYNRKYWKVPLVYAGFGALGYSVSFNTASYNKYLTAYKDFTDLIPETDSYLDIKGMSSLNRETYDPVLQSPSFNPSTESWVKTQLLNAVDYYRKYRDLSYIGIVAWYLVTIIDAHVDASLFDYDISDDINASIAPATITFAGISPGITLTLNMTF
jgi:hypothetical protein